MYPVFEIDLEPNVSRVYPDLIILTLFGIFPFDNFNFGVQKIFLADANERTNRLTHTSIWGSS